MTSPWTDNEDLTAALMYARTTALITALQASTAVPAAPPIAKMMNSGGQSIPNNTSTALTWNTEAFDTVNGHSTSSNTSRYTCQTGYDGYYKLVASVAWTANATGARRVSFAVNGTGVDGSALNSAGAATLLGINTETTVQLAAGDYVEVFVLQTSGGALTLVTGGAGNTNQSWFELQWVHP